MQRVIVRIVCDPCLDEKQAEVDGEEFILKFGETKPRSIALCERHEKKLLEPLRSAVEKLGATAATPRRRRATAKA